MLIPNLLKWAVAIWQVISPTNSWSVGPICKKWARSSRKLLQRLSTFNVQHALNKTESKCYHTYKIVQLELMSFSLVYAHELPFFLTYYCWHGVVSMLNMKMIGQVITPLYSFAHTTVNRSVCTRSTLRRLLCTLDVEFAQIFTIAPWN